MTALIWFIFWLTILILLSAFFSCSETSLFSLSRNDLSFLKEKKPSAGSRAERLLNTPKKTLVTILIGNMFVNVLSTALFEQKLHDMFHKYAILLSIAVMTPLILLFGEIIPKIIAFRFKRITVPVFSPVIRFLYVILYPFQAVSIKLSEPFLGLFSLIFPSEPPESKAYDKSEISAAIEIGAARGIFDDYEKNLVKNIMKIDTITARYLLTPRTRMFSISIDEDIDVIREKIYSSEYSRIPFYRESPDNIIGVFFKKDIFKYDNIFSSKEAFRQFLNKPWFVPETQHAGKLFALMVGRKSHIHFVVDEYGGLEGVITLEDILSNIFRTGSTGPERGLKYTRLRDETGIRVHSETRLEDFNEQLSPRVVDSDSVTLGGFASDMLGRIPEPGDSFVYQGHKFKITAKPGSEDLYIEIRPLPGFQEEDE